MTDTRAGLSHPANQAHRLLPEKRASSKETWVAAEKFHSGMLQHGSRFTATVRDRGDRLDGRNPVRAAEIQLRTPNGSTITPQCAHQYMYIRRQ